MCVFFILQGSDHLTLTWKVERKIYQHIDILERDKANHFTLGKSLWIDDEVSMPCVKSA